MVGCAGSLVATDRVPVIVPAVVGANSTQIRQERLGASELVQLPPGASEKPLLTAICDR